MARKVCTTVVIVLLSVLVGCQSPDSGRGQILPRGPRAVGPATVINFGTMSETDIIEQMAANRQAYRKGLEILVGYYTKAGDNMKLRWAKKELTALNSIPKYNYIIEATITPDDYKVSASIPDADNLYYDGVELEKKAGPLLVLKNANLLRLALEKYNQLIRKHPTSDKIDDAAFKAGMIYEYFKDYTIAVLYYKRAYQWDPDTIYPARFRAARVLDKNLHEKAEALELYQEAVKIESRFDKNRQWKEFAEKRIRELQKIDEE